MTDAEAKVIEAAKAWREDRITMALKPTSQALVDAVDALQPKAVLCEQIADAAQVLADGWHENIVYELRARGLLEIEAFLETLANCSQWFPESRKLLNKLRGTK